MALNFKFAVAGAAVAFAAIAGVNSAEASCRQVGERFFNVAKSVGTDFTYSTDNGRCFLSYTSKQTKFTSARIVTQPTNGTLKQEQAFGFRYQAKKGFAGKDTLAIEVCGETMVGKGCSLLNYELRIDPT